MTTAAAPQDQAVRIALNVAGKVYGPYSLAQFETYVTEGRVTKASVISRDGGAWLPAGSDDICGRMFAGPSPAPREAVVATASSPSVRAAFLKEMEGVSRSRTGTFADASAAERRDGMIDRRVYDQSIAAKSDARSRAEVEYGNFVLVFDVKSRHHGKLEEKIMELGTATRVLPGIWVLNGAQTCGSIRNQLIEHFGKLDSLFIIDASRDKLAWFNLGPEADSQIRKVWKKSDRPA